MESSELDQLAEVTREADQDQATAANDRSPGTGAPHPDAAEAAEWAELPKMFGSLVATAMPELTAVYTPDACMRWGEAMVPIAKKYNWNAAKFLSLFGPWLMLAITSHALVTPTYFAVRARMDAAKAAEQPAPDRHDNESRN